MVTAAQTVFTGCIVLKAALGDGFLGNAFWTTKILLQIL